MPSKYIIHDGGFAYIYRPLANGFFDVLKYKPYTYTQDNVSVVSTNIKRVLNRRTHVSRSVKDRYPSSDPFWSDRYTALCVPASFSFYYFFDTCHLRTMRGIDPFGDYHWWVEDVDNGQRYDLTETQYKTLHLTDIYRRGSPSRLYSFKEIPQSRMLDVMNRSQPSSLRFQSREICLPNTLESLV